jgi:hypothetical protein
MGSSRQQQGQEQAFHDHSQRVAARLVQQRLARFVRDEGDHLAGQTSMVPLAIMHHADGGAGHQRHAGQRLAGQRRVARGRGGGAFEHDDHRFADHLTLAMTAMPAPATPTASRR